MCQGAGADYITGPFTHSLKPRLRLNISKTVGSSQRGPSGAGGGATRPLQKNCFRKRSAPESYSEPPNASKIHPVRIPGASPYLGSNRENKYKCRETWRFIPDLRARQIYLAVNSPLNSLMPIRAGARVPRAPARIGGTATKARFAPWCGPSRGSGGRSSFPRSCDPAGTGWPRPLAGLGLALGPDCQRLPWFHIVEPRGRLVEVPT